MQELEALQKILAMGGNGAAVVAVYLGWKIYRRFESRIDRNTEAVQRVERAIIEKVPATAGIFREPLSSDKS